MSYGVPSDEVAEDYVQALQSLTMNSRYEISNLTVIAKENTEHALAISEALRLHIKQVGDLSILSFQLCYIISNLVHICLFPFLYSRRNIELLTYALPDYAAEETACILCSRLRCQKRWHAIHTLLRPAAVFDIYGGIRIGGQQYSEKDGRDAKDVERTSTWVD